MMFISGKRLQRDWKNIQGKNKSHDIQRRSISKAIGSGVKKCCKFKNCATNIHGKKTAKDKLSMEIHDCPFSEEL